MKTHILFIRQIKQVRYNHNVKKISEVSSGPDERIPVVLLHGFLASSGYWSRLLPHLNASRYRLIPIDLLGFGKAPKPTDCNYDYDAHLAFITQQLKDRPVEQPFVLIGHSMGALLAARFSALYPDKVRATVLLHPPLYTSLDEARATLRNTGTIYRFLLDSKFRGVGWGILRNVPYLGVAPHTIFSRERSLQNIIEASELPKDLARLQPDTLLVVGANDRPQYRQNLAHLHPSSAVIVAVENVNHHSPILKPQYAARLVTGFLLKVVHIPRG